MPVFRQLLVVDSTHISLTSLGSNLGAEVPFSKSGGNKKAVKRRDSTYAYLTWSRSFEAVVKWHEINMTDPGKRDVNV